MKNHTQNSLLPTLRKGFTLVEILVVMAIIAVLGSAVYGPVMGFMEKGKTTEAIKITKDFELAISSFQSDYDGILPYTSNYPNQDANIVTNDAAFLAVLLGLESANSINEREKPYFTGKTAKSKRNGFLPDGENPTSFVDPWGNPYTIRLDYDGDGLIDTSAISNPTGVYTGKQRIDTAIIATPGKDKIFNDEDDIKSW